MMSCWKKICSVPEQTQPATEVISSPHETSNKPQKIMYSTMTHEQIRAALFSTSAWQEESPKVNAVIFLDWDETVVTFKLAHSKRINKRPHDFSDAKIISPEKWEKLYRVARQANIALYVLTARHDFNINIREISAFIERFEKEEKQTSGFNKIKPAERKEIDKYVGREKILRKIMYNDFVYFAKDSRGDVIMPKYEILELIHQRKFPYLPKSEILFIDDLSAEIDPVSTKGYAVIQSDYSGKHIDAAIQFVERFVPVAEAARVADQVAARESALTML